MLIIRTRPLGANAVPALPDPCFFYHVPFVVRKFCGQMGVPVLTEFYTSRKFEIVC